MATGNANAPADGVLSGRRVRLKRRAKRLLSDGVLIMALGGERARLEPFDEPAEKLLWRLADGVVLADELDAVPDASAQTRYRAWFHQLADGGFLHLAEPDVDIDEADLQRFDRLLNRLALFESPTRSRYAILRELRGKKIGVVGVGGLASWTLYNLACCGIGEFRLIDPDVVEASNLNRSILFGEADIGRRKIDAVRDSLLRFAPRTRIEGVELQVTDAACLAPHLDGLDLLIATGDKPAWLIREWISVAARTAGVPVLHPGSGRVGPFDTQSGTGCTMCEWADFVTRHPEAPDRLVAMRRLPPPDPGPLSPYGTATAAMAGFDAFRFLIGVKPLTEGKIWRLHEDLTSQLTTAETHPRCPLCRPNAADAVPLPSVLLQDG